MVKFLHITVLKDRLYHRAGQMHEGGCLNGGRVSIMATAAGLVVPRPALSCSVKTETGSGA